MVWTGPGGQNKCPFIISITVHLIIDQTCMECLLLQDTRLGPKNIVRKASQKFHYLTRLQLNLKVL
jgi:hypothetical protein